MTQEEIFMSLSRHDQSIKSIQHQIDEIKSMTNELRVMNTALTELTSELKHTNQNILDHNRRISALEQIPKNRFEKFAGALISALASGVIGYFLAHLIG